MDLLSLGYVGVAGHDLDEWSAFATNLLGMQLAEHSATSLAFRMDDRRQRLVVDRDMAPGQRYFGWEVADTAALDRVAARVEAAGHTVTRAGAAVADRRLVADMIAFADPVGNQVEVFHGALQADAPFRPGRSISGFRTGPLGLGHVVFMTAHPDRMVAFYRDVLGFRLSDYLRAPFQAHFFHTNPRHHSLAIIQSDRERLHHLMVELFSLDDVGQGYDLAQQDPERVRVTLGRHTNDYVTSFYMASPSQFMVEYGWGGRVVDPATWQAAEFREGPSLWGHERAWLPPEQREVARKMRTGAAAVGVRAPVQVLEGNFTVMDGMCPWWDGLKQT